MIDSVKVNKKNDESKKNKKSRIAAILLATVWISYTDVTHGISADYLNSVKTEQVFVQSQQAVVAQRLTLLNKISENIVMAGEGEKYTAAQQQLIASAILVSLLSSPTAQTSFSGDNLNTNAQPLTTAIKTTLQSLQTSIPAGVELNNVSSVIQTVQNSMSASLATTLKDSSGAAVNIKSDSTLDLTPKTATTFVPNSVVAPSPAAITRLIYTGQDLSQTIYNSLQTLEITVAQLSLQQVVNAPHALNVVVIGDALSQEINFDKLNFQIKILELSNVTSLTKVNALRSGSSINIDTINLPSTVTDLKINQSTRIIAPGTYATTLPKLKTVNLTRFTSSDSFTPPAWMNEDDFFSDNAVLNLVNYNSESNAISFGSNKLTGLSSKIKTVVLPVIVTGVPTNQYITGIGMVGNVTSLDLTGLLNADITSVTLPSTVTSLTIPSTVTTVSGTSILTTLKLTGTTATVPTWAKGGSLTTTGATLDLSAMTGLGTTLDLTSLDADITSVTLPSTVTSLTIPSTVTTVSGTSILTTLKLIGTTATVPTWAKGGSLTTTGATLDLSAMTGTTLDLTSLDADITSVTLPSTVTSLTV